MGVGKYNLTAGGGTPIEQDYSGPAFNYTQPGAPPPGLGGVEDQKAINWQMAQKYGAERAQQNRDIQKLYGQAYNNWQLNGQRGPAPNQPAQFETDPNKLFTYFNSSQPGVLLQNGVVADNRGTQATVDPIQFMFNQGTPGAGGGASPGGGTPSGPLPTVSGFGTNLTPAQRATGAATGPQQQQPPAGGVPTNGVPWVASPAQTPAAQINQPAAAPAAAAPAAPAGGAAAATPPGVPPDQWFQILQYLQSSGILPRTGQVQSSAPRGTGFGSDPQYGGPRDAYGYASAGASPYGYQQGGQNPWQYQPRSAPQPYGGAPPQQGYGRYNDQYAQRGGQQGAPTPYVAPQGGQEPGRPPQFNMNRGMNNGWNQRRY